MTLTEQWKKGELKKGYYYVKGIQKYDGINVYWIGYPIHETERRWIVEVLAPVPSYEEWKELKDEVEIYHNNFKLMKAELERELENQQLKDYNEYLRNIIIECEPYIENVCIALDMEKFANGGFLHKSNELLSKIRTAIGEKKCY